MIIGEYNWKHGGHEPGTISDLGSAPVCRGTGSLD